MTGREKIEAAFSKEGTPEIAAVICYEGIYIRDHWNQLTSCPWWYQQIPEVEPQMQWRRDVVAKTKQDWISLHGRYSFEDKQNMAIELRADGVFLVDKCSGREEKLKEPRTGGWTASGQSQSIRPEKLPQTTQEIDEAVPVPFGPKAKTLTDDSSSKLASEIVKEFGSRMYLYNYVLSPLWRCYTLWGFEAMMTMVATRPDLVRYACDRYLDESIFRAHEAAAMGSEVMWLEECMTDMISPEAFGSINVPFLRRLIEEIHSLGLKCIYYYCGNPAGKWEYILSVGADAISLEESKKNFAIDIEQIVAKLGGSCTVLGNLDAVGVLQNASEKHLRAEISRQIAAGRKNGNRFIMSLGSPVTPETPVERVRLYCDLVHDLGK